MIINEEIYGNIATVYHRSKTEPEKFKQTLERNEWRSGVGAGNMYGPGLYTVFTKSDNQRSYGDYLYKLHVKGIKNFFIFLPKIYNKVWGTNKTYDEIIAEQNKRFKCNFRKYTDFVHSYSKEHSKCAGIIFHGNHDGDVCIIWEPRNVIPVSYEYDGNIHGIETGKIGMSKEYKANAFKHGGDIVDYFKQEKSLLRKIEEGNFIGWWKSDYDPNIHPDHDVRYFVKKFKKLTSLKTLAKILNDHFLENYNDYFKKNFFDSKAFGIYDKNKQLIDIIFFDGTGFQSFKCAFPISTYDALAHDIFGIKIGKIEKKIIRRLSEKGSKDTYKIGDSHLSASGRADFVKNIILPKNICNFVKIKYADAIKNLYDSTNKLTDGEFYLEFNFYKNGKKAIGEDKKLLINQLKEKIKPDNDFKFDQWIKHGNKDFKLSLVSGKVSQMASNSIAGKVADFLEKEISKTNFVSELSALISMKARSWKKELGAVSLKKKVKNVDYTATSVPELINYHSDLNEMKAKAEREKNEREQQGKYIGKHQYDILKSIQTYFPY